MMEIITIIISSVMLVISGILTLRSNIPKKTIENYKEYADSADKRLSDLEKSDQVKTGKIAVLEGQVEVLKTIPLKEISATLVSISQTIATFTEHLASHAAEANQNVDKIIDAINTKK